MKSRVVENIKKAFLRMSIPPLIVIRLIIVKTHFFSQRCCCVFYLPLALFVDAACQPLWWVPQTRKVVGSLVVSKLGIVHSEYQ